MIIIIIIIVITIIIIIIVLSLISSRFDSVDGLRNVIEQSATDSKRETNTQTEMTATDT